MSRNQNEDGQWKTTIYELMPGLSGIELTNEQKTKIQDVCKLAIDEALQSMAEEPRRQLKNKATFLRVMSSPVNIDKLVSANFSVGEKVLVVQVKSKPTHRMFKLAIDLKNEDDSRPIFINEDRA